MKPKYRTWAYEDKPGRIRFWFRRCDHFDGRPRDVWYVTPHPSYPTNWQRGEKRRPSNKVGARCIYTPYGSDLWEVLRGGGGSDDVVVWAEGEPDVDALHESDVLAFTHDGGAGRGPTPQQARKLRRFRGTVLVAVDMDDDGALDARERYRLVAEARGATRGVELIGPKGYAWGSGADMRDHLDAGHGIEDAVTLSILDLHLPADRAAERRKAAGGPSFYWGEPPPPLKVQGRSAEIVTHKHWNR